MKLSLKIKILLLLLTFIFVLWLAITKGSVNMPLVELFSDENRQILHLRVLRILMASIAGIGLAVSGIALQAILKNPLAEPYLLGTSSGAGLGAVSAIIIGIPLLYLPLMAFLGAGLTMILVYNLARHGGKIMIQSLILSGIIVSIALSGVIVFLLSISPNEALYGMMWWLWGSLQLYDIKLFFTVLPIVSSGVFIIFVLSQDLNAISVGEEEATHLGIDIEKVKKILFFVTSLITASLVCICGIIGFVGLIIPHAMRFMVGPNHKILIPAACLAAAVFMIVCDLLSRTLLSPLEIPIGIITAIVGAPIFIILLKTKQKVK